MLAQIQIPLSACGRARLSDRYTRRRMACPRVVMRSPRPDMNYVGDRIPFPVELADLLGIHIENNRDLMISFARFCLHDWQIETAARSRIQDAHQCSLCIPVTDVKALHWNHPPLTVSVLVLLPATSQTALRPPEPSDTRSPRAHNQIPATPDPASSGSDRSHRRFPATPETPA